LLGWAQCKLDNALPTFENRMQCAVEFFGEKITCITDVTEQEMVMHEDKRKGKYLCTQQ